VLIEPATLTRLFNLKPKGILHIGAHEAEEYEIYENAGWLSSGKIIWVEAQPLLAKKLELRRLPNTDRVICAAAWHESGINLTLNIASNSQSSSVFEFGTHKVSHPEIYFEKKHNVPAIRLDSVINEVNFDFIALDIQGAELNALVGLGDILKHIRWIYTECNKVEVYKSAATIVEIDNFLAYGGFKRVATKWVPNVGWGDCLYVNMRLVSRKEKIRILIGRFIFSFMNSLSIVRVYLVFLARNVLNKRKAQAKLNDS